MEPIQNVHLLKIINSLTCPFPLCLLWFAFAAISHTFVINLEFSTPFQTTSDYKYIKQKKKGMSI